LTTHQDIAADLIRRHEGLRTVVYDDATGKALKFRSTVIGHPTIGYGRNLQSRGLFADEIELLLTNDLRIAERIAEDFALEAWPALSDTRKAVLMSMAHQLGRVGLMAFVHFQRAILAGDIEGAAVAMLDSKWEGQTPARAHELAELWQADAMLASSATLKES
jgi:lysozyme